MCVFVKMKKKIISASADKTIKIWDKNLNIVIHTLYGHEDSVFSLVLSANDSKLLSGSGDKTVKLWDTATGSLVTTFNCDHPVEMVEFSVDESLVLGCRRDQITVWETKTGEILKKLKGFDGLKEI